MQPMNRSDDCIVSIAATLRDVMHSLERTRLAIVLVVDAADRLLGLVTDGDLRRALLQGADLSAPIAPHLNTRFTSVAPSAGRAEVLDLMQARRLGQIPILDERGRVLGLHLLHDILGAQQRPNWAVIMAGGRGSRLAPLTDTIPKPMIRVAGRPILERIVLHLVGFGIRHVYLSINYLGHVVRDHFGDGQALGCQIHYLEETSPLGTGGALSLLPELPSEPLVVMNGDLITQTDLGAMLDFHALGGQQATVGVRRYFHRIPFGCLEVEDDRVLAFDEKPAVTRLVNAGIYVLDPQVVARVPKNREFPLPAVLTEAVALGEHVRCYEIEEDWIDVGQRDQLKQAMGLTTS